MTNPTRAELQAQIEELQRKLAEVPAREWKIGDHVVIRGEVIGHDPIEYQVQFADGELWIEGDALIPAADLIPRDEHDRAVADLEARLKAATGGSAEDTFRSVLEDSVGFIGVNTSHGIYTGEAHNLRYSLHVWKANHGDKCPHCRTPDPQPDAEPVGWAIWNTVRDLPYYRKLYRTRMNAESVAADENRTVQDSNPYTAVPLYRHPAPQPVVAAQGVKDALHRMADSLQPHFGELAYITTAQTKRMKQLADKITELPPPSEEDVHIASWCSSVEVCLQRASAFTQRAALLERAQGVGHD